jgi:hypothetical protein
MGALEDRIERSLGVNDPRSRRVHTHNHGCSDRPMLQGSSPSAATRVRELFEPFEPGNPHHVVFSATAPIFFDDINYMFKKCTILAPSSKAGAVILTNGESNLIAAKPTLDLTIARIRAIAFCTQ